VFFIGLFFLTAVINHTRPSAQKQSKQNRSFGGVSVKRRVGVEFQAGVGVGVGVGVEVGVRVSLLYLFFHSFNPNSDFSQFASAVYHYNIFRLKGNKKMWWS